MNNVIQLINQSDVPAPSPADEYDRDLTDEGRLATEFFRLYHQYRRAGYDYHQRMQQSGLKIHPNSADVRKQD